MTKFNQLQTKDDFAKLLGFKNARYINYLLYNVQTDNLYTTFTIPKKEWWRKSYTRSYKRVKISSEKIS